MGTAVKNRVSWNERITYARIPSLQEMDSLCTWCCCRRKARRDHARSPAISPLLPPGALRGPPSPSEAIERTCSSCCAFRMARGSPHKATMLAASYLASHLYHRPVQVRCTCKSSVVVSAPGHAYHPDLTFAIVSLAQHSRVPVIRRSAYFAPHTIDPATYHIFDRTA